MGAGRGVSVDSHTRIVRLAERLNRYRALTEEETDWLEHALRKEAEAGFASRKRGEGKQFWDADVETLRRMLANGKSPAQIAAALRRTPRAVYRKMYKLGLHCGQGSVAVTIAAE